MQLSNDLSTVYKVRVSLIKSALVKHFEFEHKFSLLVIDIDMNYILCLVLSPVALLLLHFSLPLLVFFGKGP
jgi:hypothetical protein